MKEITNSLPEAFVHRMKKLLDVDFNSFIESYSDPRYYGLRVNEGKISVEDFLQRSPFDLDPVPWTKNGFYYREDERPGKHPYYYAGLYYIQEPSAMAPGALIQVQPGDRVLDLCAAPGGKSTQLAAALQGEGLLVANDSSSDRVRPLYKNLELFGIRNAVVTNETPDRLAKNFPEFFDKILIDAPCSGEGMFRKDEEAARSWEIHSVEVCVLRQREILKEAAKMLKPGGTIIYSTCTFAPEEDEGMIEEFLNQYPDFEILDIPKEHGFAPGQPLWANGRAELAGSIRLWPHRLKGEGHFVAWLKKNPTSVNLNEENLSIVQEECRFNKKKGHRDKEKSRRDKEKGKESPINLDDYHKFINENLKLNVHGKFQLYGEHLYLTPEEMPDLSGLKVVRPGWYLGIFKKNRFEPSPAMALGLKKEEIVRKIDFEISDPRVIKYLKGETLNTDNSEKGWTIVCVEGYPLGWAKQTEGVLKNYYPKGWRWMD